MPVAAKGAGRARIPWGIAGALALVVLVESRVGRRDLHLTHELTTGYRASGEAASRVGDCRLLCLGDSLIKHGVAPRVLEERLGLRAYNLASAGGVAPLTYFLLRRALDSGARPTALVIDAFPTQLQTDPLLAERSLAAVLRPGEALDLARRSHDAGLPGRLLAARLLPSVAHRAEIREVLTLAAAGVAAQFGPVNRVAARNVRVNRGAYLLEKNPDAERTPEHPDEAVIMAMGPWGCHPTNAAYLRGCLDLAAARGIVVYWLLPPIQPRLQARRERSGYDAGYDRMVEGLLVRYPNLTVIDGRHAGYPGRVFHDGSHLDAQGAYAYSLALAEVLRRPGPGSRRVILPTCRDFPVPDWLEDRTGSAHALFGRARPKGADVARRPGRGPA
jgi:hypothetical protein